MPKVILNKTTKIKDIGMVLAGVEIEVTDAQKKKLEKDGFIGEDSKSNTPTNEKEINALVKKVKDLEDELAKNGNADEMNALKAELETVKADLEASNVENEALKAELETVKADLEASNVENEALKAELETVKAAASKKPTK